MQTETVAAGPSGEGKASDGARPALGDARGKGANVNCEICQKLSDSLVSMKEYYSISEAAVFVNKEIDISLCRFSTLRWQAPTHLPS